MDMALKIGTEGCESWIDEITIINVSKGEEHLVNRLAAFCKMVSEVAAGGLFDEHVDLLFGDARLVVDVDGDYIDVRGGLAGKQVFSFRMLNEYSSVDDVFDGVGRALKATTSSMSVTT